MNKLNLIDIHTHNVNNSDNGILDISESFNIPDFNQNKKFNISCGIHPWKISNSNITNNKQLQLISKYSLEKKLCAIGEIGLDLCCDIPLELQINILKIQFNIAIEYNLPVIIHCVKAYSNFLSIFKNSQTLPSAIIFHDFSANLNILKQLEKYNVYFSFGNKLLKDNQNSINAIQYLNPKKIFLESDNLDIEIITVYNTACKILNMPISEFSKIINSNFEKVFVNI